ncbi:TAXI family TRAP transporter solute-binding subunit [uncultured Sphaerochaeta sp.]|uniref:TAXI family TRAP transporter solute-binding subunit n=1 Tax=uncultured Sphaerochaeta sp. TaxID=886478 RepID=UPI002A0A2AF4|nr:TAXI family TRAP transporter solute-binding subunit [uncultured Sphaerochaeta sp.]
MKKTVKVASLVLISVFVLVSLMGCSKKENASVSTETTTKTAKPTKKYDLIMGTAGTSGTYYVVGAAMGASVNKNSDKVNVIVQPTKGSIENLNLANTDDIQLGFSNSDGVYWAATGTGNYAKTGKLKIQAVMNLYRSQGQMVALKNSGIKTFGDLKGKKVNLGPSGQTVVEISKTVLRAYGIDPEKDITPLYLAVDEGLSKLKDGEIDASFFSAAYPAAGVVNIASTTDIRLVDIDDEILKKICADNPFYSYGIIPANTYNGQIEDCRVVEMITELFASSAAPEDAIYEFVKQALETQPQYVTAHVSIKEITPQFASQCVTELHPGALKYYKEKGLR